VTRDRVAEALERRIAAGWMPGAAWWVEGPLTVLSRGAVGHAALAPDPESATERTVYDLASLTKPLAAALPALLLEQEGLLDPEAPLEELLPETADSPYARTTVAELASHRARFPAWRPLYLEALEPADYLSRLLATPPAVERGQTLYSDLGYILLGMVVERIQGESLDRIFERRVAKPLGLEGIGFAARGRVLEPVAPTERGNLYEREMAGGAGRGHPWRSEILRGEVHDANAWGLGGVAGHAGLFGTAAAVATIARELLKPRRLSLRNPARMFREATPGCGRTFGFELASQSAAAQGALPDDAPGHTGFTGTSLWIEPERERVYVLLTNRVHPAVQLRGIQPVRNEFHRLAAALPDRSAPF
jgi:CubicO group peptidase (beta-lactamase class C family)